MARTRKALRAQKPLLVRLELFAGVVSLALTISVGGTIVNSDSVRLPSWEAAVCKTAAEVRGPLDGMFRDRFGPEWTETQEAALLGEIVAHRLLADKPAPNLTETTQFIFSNQQENLALESPRLSLGQIRRIVSERKIS
jgi:hypothetical protein